MYKSEFCNVKETKRILENGVSDVLFKVYHKNKGTTYRSKNISMNRPTLSQRMDRLEDSINKLAKIVSDGFSEIRQDVIGINTRLDYIVKANNLKDSK